LAQTSRAISLGVSALIAIALTLIVGFGAFISTIVNTTSTNIVSNNSSIQTFTHQLTQTYSPSTSTSSSSFACTISAEPTGFYLHVVSDNSGLPVQGANLTATLVSVCDNVNSTLTDSHEYFTTNSSGWTSVVLSFVPSGNYFLIFNVVYYNSSFTFAKTFDVYWLPEQGAFVTLSIPSGNVTIVYRTPLSCNVACTYATSATARS